MDHFSRIEGALHAEGVPLSEVAKAYGTPTYVYAHATIAHHAKVLQDSLKDLPTRLCYAVKANGNLAVLDTLRQAGCDFDAVSQGELLRVQRIGGDLRRCIFSGVGKTADEIAAALRLGVMYISVESAEELQCVAQVADSLQLRAPVSLRMNPDVDAKTHPYISTGMAENKFGVPGPSVQALVAQAMTRASVRLVGLSCHIGSQITSLTPFADAAQILADTVRAVDALLPAGDKLQFVGMGGGLGIPYAAADKPPSPSAYGACLAPYLQPLGKTLVLEPGRVLVGNAGILLCRVVRKKQHGARNFVLVDAGMNDLLRPALYQAQHRIEAVAPRAGTPVAVDVVGPVCESADTFAKGLLLPPLEEGDLLAIRSAGAYGFVMASQYNGRPKAAEVMCRGETHASVGRRESHEELWRLEATLPPLPA